MSEQRFYLVRGENETSEGTLFPLGDLPCTVGRGSSCQLQLDFQRISREHARFELRDGALLLTDLGSTNGTFLNHRRLEEPEPLDVGDIIHFGNHPFVLKMREPSGDTLVQTAASQAQSSHDTIIGFTAQPTGFPVQAPEFFEMLNDEQIAGTAQPVVTSSGTVIALTLNGRSSHPELHADSTVLFRLAEDLGEEARLAQLIRRICLEQASQAGLQSTLILPVHAAECEDLDILVDEWRQLVARYRHLALACDIPLTALGDPEDLNSLRSHLKPLEVEICGSALGLPASQLAHYRSSLDFLRVNALRGPDRITELVDGLGSFVRILVDQINESGLIQPFSDAGATLFQGAAVSETTDLSTFS